jgi:hypothetical protein
MIEKNDGPEAKNRDGVSELLLESVRISSFPSVLLDELLHLALSLTLKPLFASG